MSRVKIEAWPSVSALVPKDVALEDQFQKMEADKNNNYISDDDPGGVYVTIENYNGHAIVSQAATDVPGTCTMGDNHVPLSL